jgi:hypothetical protein
VVDHLLRLIPLSIGSKTDDVFYDAENDGPGWVLIGTANAATTRLVPVARAVEYGNEVGA